MPAINALTTRDALVASLVRREKSWPAREPGVMVVLCIVFVVAVAVIGLWLGRLLKARKEKAAIKASQAGH